MRLSNLKIVVVMAIISMFSFCSGESNQTLLGDAVGQGGPYNSPTENNSIVSQDPIGPAPSLEGQDEVADEADGSGEGSTTASEDSSESDNENADDEDGDDANAEDENDDDEIIDDSEPDEEGNAEENQDEAVTDATAKKNRIDQGPAQKCVNRKISLDTSKGRWSQTAEGKDSRGKKIKGIQTAWANEKLILRVTDNCQAGWYRLRILAKNVSGPLPDFYTHFNVLIKDGLSSEYLGGLNIKASDDRYHGRGRLVYLNEGDSEYILLWTNDAYLKGVYDANIQIKKVKLKYKRYIRRHTKLVRRANQYCSTKGRWFWNKKSAYTHWANQEISFCYPNLPSGKYEVIVKAKNKGVVPPGYEFFKVKTSADGVSDTLLIKASETRFNRGSIFLDLTGGNTRVNLKWTNDKWKKGVYDANIMIHKIRLRRVGASERSALAAHLSQASITNKVLYTLLGIALIGLLASFLLKRRKVI